MCLKFVTERAEIYHGYKCGNIDKNGYFKGYNFTGSIAAGQWAYAKGSFDTQDENDYPHGFHIFPDLNDAIKFAGVHFYGWLIYKVSYRGILAKGVDQEDTKVDVAAMMYVHPEPVKLEPDFSGV